MLRLKKSLSLHKSLLIISFIACLAACAKSSDNDNTDAAPKTQTLYLNDTGVTRYTQVLPYRTIDDPMPQALSSTPDETALHQDAFYGIDNDSNVSDNDGNNGFQFTRLDSDGNTFTTPPTDYAVTPWSCVKDKVTGLIWEVKTISGLQANFNTYSWYSSDSKTNGGFAGALNDDASCYKSLTNCNTENYINAVNAMNNGKGLCGINNWRLPLREELRSILDYSITTGAMIDTAFFPNAMASDTWSAQTAFYGDKPGEQAWEVHFNVGYSEAHDKSSSGVYTRLVHDPVE